MAVSKPAPMENMTTVGDYIAFLSQFDREAICPVFMNGEDQIPFVNGGFDENPDGPWIYPMIVVDHTDMGWST